MTDDDGFPCEQEKPGLGGHPVLGEEEEEH